MSRQWGRAVKVKLGSTVLVDFDTSRRPGDQERGLDCSFTVSRLSDPTPQKSKLRVWGLSERVRQGISRIVTEAREQAWQTQQALRTAQITIEAGRPGRTVELSADWVLDVKHAKDGADWVTDFECEDGRLAWSSGFVSETRSGTVDPLAAALALQKSLGLLPDSDVTTTAEAAPALAAGGFRGFPGGLATFGPVKQINEQLMSALGRRPIWRRGQLVWTRPDIADLKQKVILQEGSNDAGGTLLHLEEPVALGMRKARAMLDGLLEIGRQVVLTRADGTQIEPYPFRVSEVTHSAATRENTWQSELLLRPSALD